MGHYVNDQFVYNDGKNCQPFPLISNKKIIYGSHSVCENVLEHKDLKSLKTREPENQKTREPVLGHKDCWNVSFSHYQAVEIIYTAAKLIRVLF